MRRANRVLSASLASRRAWWQPFRIGDRKFEHDEAQEPTMKACLGPHGQSFFDRSSGLDVLLDEVEIPPSLCPLRHVSIADTDAYDLACPYCYAPKHHATSPVDRLLAWIRELDAAKTDGLGCGWGEPTLYKHRALACSYAAENTGLAVTMTTHGLPRKQLL